jgi:hypothetical protein
MSFAPRQEPEHVPGGRLASIGVISIAIGVGAVLVALAIEHATTRHPWEYSSVPALPQRGIVEHSLFSDPGRGATDVRARREELARWSWADRRAGLARMPIDRAIDLYVSRHGAPSAPPRRQPPRPVLPTTDQEAGKELGMKTPDWRAR